MKKLIFISLIGLWLVWPVPLLAQEEPAGIQVTPAIIEQPLSPGVSTTFSLSVTNISGSSLAVAVGTRPLAPLDPFIDDSLRSRYDASTWITPVETSLLLAPNESKDVQLIARADDNAGPGGHYTFIVLRVLGVQAPASGSSTQVTPEVTVATLMTLPGDIVERAELKLTQPPIWQRSRPQSLDFQIFNRGNIHFLPVTTADFQPVLAGKATEISSQPRLILPGTASTFQLEWPELEWGLYRVKVNTAYGSPTQTVEDTTRLFFVPPPLWIQAVSLIVFGFFIWLFTRPFKKSFKRFKRPRRLAKDDKDLKKPPLKAEELDYLTDDSAARDSSRRQK